jgi:hypothetical protein
MKGLESSFPKWFKILNKKGIIISNQANIVLFRVTIQVEPSNVEISQKEDIPKGSKTFNADGSSKLKETEF